MIRKANHKDIQKINEFGSLLHNNFEELFHIESEIDSELGIVLVNIDNNEIINGYLYAQNFFDNIDLLSIFVDNNCRCKNIGTNLLNYLKESYPGKTITLEVACNNEPAIKLYEKNGFIEVGKRKKYYDGIDAIVMKWGI